MIRRSFARLILGVAILATTTLVPAQITAAHCPGTNPADGRDYSADRKTFTQSYNGIKATIAWTSQSVCGVPAGNAFTLEATTLCLSPTCTGHVQVGWVKAQTWADPLMFCEFHKNGGPTTQYFFTLSHATHTFAFTYDSFDSIWDCLLDGSGKASLGSMGWSSGTFANVQGEVNSVHATIGVPAPGKLLFSALTIRNASTSVWSPWDPNSLYVESPYGGDEPATDQFRNWTNAH